jgi:hypothetical protein
MLLFVYLFWICSGYIFAKFLDVSADILDHECNYPHPVHIVVLQSRTKEAY